MEKEENNKRALILQITEYILVAVVAVMAIFMNDLNTAGFIITLAIGCIQVAREFFYGDREFEFRIRKLGLAALVLFSAACLAVKHSISGFTRLDRLITAAVVIGAGYVIYMASTDHDFLYMRKRRGEDEEND